MNSETSELLIETVAYFQNSELRVHTHDVTEDYEVTHQVLGVGINGKVVECYHKETKEKFALKVLADDHRSRREIELHYLCCNHRNFVKIFDVYANIFNGLQCLLVVMECMEGGELFSRIQARATTAFTEREAAHIMYEISSAIEYLHGMNIAHRDIKPEHLLYSTKESDGVLKLVDFGFAKQIHLSELETPCCPTYYTAPELFSLNKYDKSCDMWSLGIIMYILLCGYPPFYSANDQASSPGMSSRIQSGNYEFRSPEWDLVSEPAKSLIRGLLRTVPQQRLTIEQVMNHLWITHHRKMPKTRLHTPTVLAHEKRHWSDVEHEMQLTLASMRVDSDECVLKELTVANNPLLIKRRKRDENIRRNSLPTSTLPMSQDVKFKQNSDAEFY